MASRYLAAGIAVLPALAHSANTARAACADVHLFLARGTTEGYPGTLGSLATLVTGSINGSTYENILYPATQEGSTPSYQEGIANGTAQVQAYAAACPDSKLVLLGYSQVRSRDFSVRLGDWIKQIFRALWSWVICLRAEVTGLGTLWETTHYQQLIRTLLALIVRFSQANFV